MDEVLDPYLNAAALGLLLTIIVAGIYLIIYIHDIPYEIARKRNHPNQDAFHIAGWVSLFLMHSIWPLLWIWAYWYKPNGEPVSTVSEEKDASLRDEKISVLESELSLIKAELVKLTNEKTSKE